MLISLAEIAVESDESEYVLRIPLSEIAEKFANLYWPQTAPYVSRAINSNTAVLFQNQGKQAAVINELLKLRAGGANTLAQAKLLNNWQTTLNKIASTIEDMPLPRLQNIGGKASCFVYDYPISQGVVVLRPGVAGMLRSFHPLIQQLTRSGWIRHIRENQHNTSIIGHTDELESFMFGSSRIALNEVRLLLSKIQARKCFYCNHVIQNSGDIDHFIPWSKYPRDLALNFVLAHPQCNRSKSDMLAAQSHLVRWVDRNAKYGDEIQGSLNSFFAPSNSALHIARWAYTQGISAGAVGWISGTTTEPLQAALLTSLTI